MKITLDEALDSLAVDIVNIFRLAETAAVNVFYREFDEHQRIHTNLEDIEYDDDSTFNNLILSELKTLRENYIKITKSD